MIGLFKPDWSREGRDWPNRDASRFVRAGALDWHVQIMGQGPVLLLLHGTAAATHSWRDFAPRLARDFTLVALDLPGHGFTGTPEPRGQTLPGMARLVTELMRELGIAPDAVVGHSAGAAVGLRLALDGRIGQGGVISLNGAFRPFPGASAPLFSITAKMLFLNPLAIQMFAWRAAQPGAVERLIEGTGSTIDSAGIGFYRRLMGTTGHVAGALGMMSNWALEPLQADMGRLKSPLTLLVADGDRAVPPDVARDVVRRVPQAQSISLQGLGHLAHEEAPEQVADLTAQAVRRALSSTPI